MYQIKEQKTRNAQGKGKEANYHWKSENSGKLHYRLYKKLSVLWIMLFECKKVHRGRGVHTNLMII